MPQSFVTGAAPAGVRPAIPHGLAIAGVAGAALLLAAWRLGPAIGRALDLDLPDSDDALRLVTVRDLLAGQSWFDPVQGRYLPPAGTEMHWSRLVDAPIAALILALRAVFGEARADGLASALWPALLFCAYLAIVGTAVRRLFGLAAALFAVVVPAQSLVLGDLFGPGRIDHHNVQVILLAGAIVAAARSAVAPGRSGGLAGALAALSLAVGLETLPFVGGIGLALALRFVLAGTEAEGRALRGFTLGLAGAALAGFLTQTAPARWAAVHPDALSLPWLALAAGAAAFAIAATGPLPRGTRIKRGGALALGGLVLVAAVALAFPSLLGGPYGMVPEPARSLWLDDIPEAYPAWRVVRETPDLALKVFGPLLAAALAAAAGAWLSRGEARLLLALSAVTASLGAALTLVQLRGVYVSTAVLPFACAWLAGGVLRPGASGPAKAAAAAGLMLCLTAPWNLLAGGRESTHSRAPHYACERGRHIAALDRIAPATVMAPIDLAAKLLLHTRHGIVAGGYHRAPEGIVAGIEGFAGDGEALRRVMRRHGAEVLALCPGWVLSEPHRYGTFARGLVEGAPPPDWLAPVDLGGSVLRAWRVTRPGEGS